MILQLNQNRRFAIILTVAILLHVLMLFIPVVRQLALDSNTVNTIRVQFDRPPKVIEPTIVEPQPPSDLRPVDRTPVVPPTPVELSEIPAPPPEPVRPGVLRDAPHQVDISNRILSRQFDYEKTDQPFGEVAPESADRPDFYVRSRPALEDVLNEPSLQLPFRDNRIYLVDSYSTGIVGNVERFFDEVTVPFGFTTKHNTRVQCAWVMIIAGCSWGHVSLFQRKAQRRRANSGEGT